MDDKQDSVTESYAMFEIGSSGQGRADHMNNQLLESAQKNNVTEVKELIRKGADINFRGDIDQKVSCTPLILAAEGNYKELCEILLLTPGIDINLGDGHGVTALYSAVSRRNIEIVKLLLKREDIDINRQDTLYQLTPLIVAAGSGYKEVVQELLKVPEIMVNRVGKNGNSALHDSASRGHLEVVEILLHVPGIWVNQKNKESSRTPLHLAIDARHSDTVEVLLSHPDVDVNVKDKYGQTPFHVAAYYGNLRIVQLLLDRGILVNEKSNDGLTALDWAEKQGHVDVSNIIVNHPNYKRSDMNGSMDIVNNVENVDYVSKGGDENVVEMAAKMADLSCVVS